MKQNIGIQYLAFGYPFFLKALYSALSFKRKYNWPVSIVTNVKFDQTFTMNGVKAFDHVELIVDEDKNNRLYKTSVYKYSPFEKTIFLDCDTEVIGNLNPAEDLLTKFELLARLHSWPIEYNDPEGRLSKLSYQTKENPHWNSGVLLYRKSNNVENFFMNWNKKFVEFGYHMDQPSFAETILQDSNVRFQSLDMSWNCSRDFARIHPSLVKNLRIDHYRTSLTSIKREVSLNSYILTNKIVDPKYVTPDFLKSHSQLRFLAKKVAKYIW